MTVRKFRKSWWVDFRDRHVRYRLKSPENSKSGAQAYEALLRQKLIRGEDITLAKSDEKQKERKQKFKEFAWTWFATYVKNNNKHSEISNKECTLRAHLVPFFGETQIDKISDFQVERYKARKIRKGLMNKSINNHLTVLATCLHTAQDWLELKKIPKIKKLQTPPPATEFLSHRDCDALVANSSGVWQDIFLMASKTGLRRGELKGLQWSDINWKNKTLTVRHSWCDHKKGLVTPKSNRERHVPLTDALYTRLLQSRQETGFVFRTESFPRVTNKMLYRALNNACKKAGIRKITVQLLRHTFASHLAMSGAYLKAIQELLGHADIKTTMRYAHLSPSTLRETVGLLDSVKIIPTHFGQQVGNGVQCSPNISSQFKAQNTELALFKAVTEH